MNESLSKWLASMPDQEVRVEALTIMSQRPTMSWAEISAEAGFRVCMRRRVQLARLAEENEKLRKRAGK